MMTDAEIENLYKEGLNVSHSMALRAVFDAGYLSGKNVSMTTETIQSMTLTEVLADVPDVMQT
jgi:hypothetical protein